MTLPVEKKFKPIIGCEMWICENNTHKRLRSSRGRHIIVLAKNHCGYENLLQLINYAWSDGFYYHPQISHTQLASHRAGLIVCSACLGSEIASAILSDNIKEAKDLILWYKKTFGGDYYLELQRFPSTTLSGFQAEIYANRDKVNEQLIRFGKKFGIKLVATNDVHFTPLKDAGTHKLLIMKALNLSIEEADEWYGYSRQEWLKTSAEMYELFQDIPEALANTKEILDKVEFYSVDRPPMFPKFPLTEG